MKNILKKVAGFTIVATLALFMLSCENDSGGSKEPEKEKEPVETPVFSVESGEVGYGTEVAISCATEGAKIYYTTNGEDPTTSSTEYSKAIKLDVDKMTLKAFAVKEGMKDSEIASAEYVTKKEIVATPTFSVQSGEVEKGIEIKITCATAGVKIYYTTDGSAPTTSSTLYSKAIKFDADKMTLKAIAVKEGMKDSAVAIAEYVRKKETVATPTFDVKEGVVEDGTEVVIRCATAGATIYYTTNGKNPTKSSTKYSKAIKLDAANTTLKAFAVKEGMIDSGVASAKYEKKMDFPLIKAGTFKMGSNKGDADCRPVRDITISKAFYMCDHEVTQAEYKAIMGTNPSGFTGGADSGEVQQNRPVERVSWYMAIVYCNKRSIKEGLVPCYKINGKTDPNQWGAVPDARNATWDAVSCDWNASGYRLPTEAEWEFAARAGDNTIDLHTWSGTSSAIQGAFYIWFKGNANSKTHEVKKKSANANRLYDMSGNVWEWCWDWWRSEGYPAGNATDPRGISSGSYRSRRGGAYGCDGMECTVAIRCDLSDPFLVSSDVGFRVCRSKS